jgi:hypothetical protein
LSLSLEDDDAMRNLFSLLCTMLASSAAALGMAAMARKYSEPSPDRGVESAGAPLPASPGGTQPAHGATLKPGWSRPKPEKIPPPTYWPAVFGLGLTFIMWGVISNIFLLCFGLIITAIGLVYWVLDLRHEYSE